MLTQPLNKFKPAAHRMHIPVSLINEEMKTNVLRLRDELRVCLQSIATEQSEFVSFGPVRS